MWTKICGNTRLQDCLLAAELGADAVGFVFAAGKRTVTTDDAAAITAHLPASLEKVGVFTSNDADEIAHHAKAVGLTGIQLHRRYDPGLVRGVIASLSSGRPVRLLQVVHWDVDAAAADQLDDFSATIRRIAADGLIQAVLIDSRTAQRAGGTGHAFDWKAAAPVLRASALPVIVAGGLNPENVTAAIDALQPWGIDVSSGVERSPGVKDGAAIERFLQHARMSRQQLASG